ncbi:IS256 family transposase [Actinomyces sp.]|uniref:IS256 family transposase n=1 Tax=Actinomyces sp. TaxID=29317 RepID=UPI0026DCC004|nr:IS256 family transposase [Actinomyces sp.]MDO4901853.1 IS256 family transposase [Actinomyces sp.]
MICQAWIEGVSTRKVDDLVKAMGNESGISKATVSRVCKDIDEGVHEFLSRPLDHTWFPHCLFLDATYVDVRLGHRVVSQALVVATGVSAQGRREILGMSVGDAETTDFWTAFLRSLRERGLKVPTDQNPEGVVLVTSDAHWGIKNAVKAILPGASWQRCRVHFARNVTSKLGSARSKPVNALISTIFAQTTSEAVKDTYKQVIKSLRASFPEIAQMLVEAEPDLTAFAAFPREHWQKIWTGNPIERLNREIKRRTDVVQDSCPTGTPSPDWSVRSYKSSTKRWQYGERRYLSETSLRHLTHILHEQAETTHPIMAITA